MAEYPQATEAQIKDGKGLAWLSYFGILFLIPLLANKDNPYSRWHAVQGMTLFIAYVVLIIVLRILMLIPYVWWVFLILLIAVGILTFVFALIGIIKSAQGKFWTVPIVGSMGANMFKGLISGSKTE